MATGADAEEALAVPRPERGDEHDLLAPADDHDLDLVTAAGFDDRLEVVPRRRS